MKYRDKFQKNIALKPEYLVSFDDLKRLLQEQNLLEFAYESVFIEIDDDIRKNVAPKFVGNIASKREDNVNGFRAFQESVKLLYDSVYRILPTLNKLENLKVDTNIDLKKFGSRRAPGFYKMTLIGTILSDLPDNYSNIVSSFYSTAFKAFCNCNYPPLSKFVERILLELIHLFQKNYFTRVFCRFGKR